MTLAAPILVIKFGIVFLCLFISIDRHGFSFLLLPGVAAVPDVELMIISIIPERRVTAQELIDSINTVAGLTGGFDGRVGEKEVQEQKRQECEEQGA